MRKIYVYEIDGVETGIINDDIMMTQVSFGVPTKVLEDTTENRAIYGLDKDSEPKIVDVLKSSQ